LKPWLRGSLVVSAPIYVTVGLLDDHKTLRLVCYAAFYSFWFALLFVGSRYRFETVNVPGTKWYTPWKSARFSIPTTVRILVRDVNFVSPWYVEKLGLRKSAEKPFAESGVATYRFKEDGNSIMLTNKQRFGREKTPILFAKNITKMRDVLSARGVESGPIESDRQGTRYFEIHDPEGNVIEVVEDN
jgi:predicted enzyme related to lactoylglutathione lyase